MADPLELPGLAHFLEHMLFYASRKYPTEDEYSKFISEHGGHTNAYTASENTNYHCAFGLIPNDVAGCDDRHIVYICAADGHMMPLMHAPVQLMSMPTHWKQRLIALPSFSSIRPSAVTALTARRTLLTQSTNVVLYLYFAVFCLILACSTA